MSNQSYNDQNRKNNNSNPSDKTNKKNHDKEKDVHQNPFGKK